MGSYDPASLQGRHRQMVRLSFQGYNHIQIGKLFGMHQKSVTRLLNSKKARLFAQEYEDYIHQSFLKGVDRKFKEGARRVQMELEKGNLRLAGVILEGALDISWTKKHFRRKRRTIEQVIAEIIARGKDQD